MHGQNQGAVAVIEPSQQGPERGYLRGADRAAFGFGDQFLCDHVPGFAGGRRQVLDFERHLAWRVYLLVGRVGVPDHEGAEQFVACDHVVERALEQREVHVTGDADLADQQEPGAERPAITPMVEGDEPFLGKRQRVPLRLRRERGRSHTAFPYFRVSVLMPYLTTFSRAGRPMHLRRCAQSEMIACPATSVSVSGVPGRVRSPHLATAGAARPSRANHAPSSTKPSRPPASTSPIRTNGESACPAPLPMPTRPWYCPCACSGASPKSRANVPEECHSSP